MWSKMHLCFKNPFGCRRTFSSWINMTFVFHFCNTDYRAKGHNNLGQPQRFWDHSDHSCKPRLRKVVPTQTLTQQGVHFGSEDRRQRFRD